MNILEEHGGYLTDVIKLERFRSALAEVVIPGCTVLDLGCGSGILGLMALQAGAGFVHCVDETAAIEIARRTLVEAGYGDKVAFHRKRSFELELPDRVDVVVCDHIGYFGIDYGALELLSDARTRFLKPDGKLLPRSVDLVLAGVESDACYERIARWSAGQVPAEYRWVGALAANQKHDVTLRKDELLTGAATLASLELGRDHGEFLSWEAALVCTRDGLLHGLGGWFDCELTTGVRMTNSPLAPESLKRSQVFLAVDKPLAVTKGTRINVGIMMRPADNLLSWTIEIPERGQRLVSSTWNGLLLDGADLARARPDRQASISKRGRARQIVLGYVDGERTVADIVQLVLDEHPDLMPHRRDLSEFVYRVLAADAGDD